MLLIYAIIILGAITGILLLLKERFKGTKHFNKILGILIIFIIVGAVGQIYIEQEKEFKAKYSMRSGTISGELKDKTIIYPMIKIGTANLIIKNSSSWYSITDTLGIERIEVWIEDGELKLSTVIRDEKGDVIVRIDANEWQLTSDGALYWDKNFDKTAFEVIDENEDVIMQAEFDGEGVIFAGKFYRKYGGMAAIGYNMIEWQPSLEEIEAKFEKIFEYPSELYPGVRL